MPVWDNEKSVVINDDYPYGIDVDSDTVEITFNVDCGTGAGGFKKGNTCATGSGGQSRKMPKVILDPDSIVKVKRILKEIDLTSEDLVNLTGSLGAKTVVVRSSAPSGYKTADPYVMVTTNNDHMSSIAVYRDHLRIGWMSANETHKGVGFRVLSDIVDAATDRDFSHIGLEAAREEANNPVNNMNGYYTWARLGFDGKVDGPNGKVKVSELMKTKSGREWWLENGDSFNGEFDLSVGSLSSRVLKAYRKEKGL